MLQCDNGSAHRDNRSFSSPDVTGVSVHRATQLFPDDDAWNTSLADRAVGAGGGGRGRRKKGRDHRMIMTVWKRIIRMARRDQLV